MQAGKTLAVRMRAATAGGVPLTGLAMASFFRPGKDPEHVVADRQPDREAVLVFDPVTRLHGAEISTAGWEPGTWTVQGRTLGADGAPAGWAFHQFGIEA